MVFPCKSRDPNADTKNKSSSKKAAGHTAQTRKPLKNRKIYLDVKNHSLSSKLEGRLKLLGATIEVFLVKDVNLVVTDRPNWCSGSSLPSPSLQTPTGACSVSPATTDSPGAAEQAPRSAKSRAEAMLEKALLQPKQISLDPLDNAVHWGITIWPLEKVLKWLDKVNSTDKTHSQDSRLLDKPFIKLETSHRHCPSYKEFSVWPTIAVDFDAGGCPFSVPKHNSGKNVAQANEVTERADTVFKETDGLSESLRMTRKARSKLHQDVCSVRLPGYCEICQVKYSDQKTHVQSENHLQFVSNDRNFVSLDLLIQRRSSMDAFFQLNGASELTQCSMLGNPRRSLRSVLKLASLDSQALPQDYVPPNGQHATRASTLNMRQTLDDKQLSKVAQHEPLEILCNGMVNHNYETRHGSKVPAPIRRSFWDERAKPRRARTTSASFCNFSEDSEPLQLSPTGSDLGHKLRSRGQISIPKSLPADEKLSRWCDVQSPPVHSTKDQPDQPSCIIKDLNNKETHKPCRGNSEVIRKKRPSAEEKLIEDNKAYYKLELKNSKLRSSRYFIPHKVSEANHTKTEVSFSNTNGEKIGEGCASVKVMEETAVKVKKKQKQRRTELSVLSDEAESFMFGEPSRHDSSYESTEEELEASVVKRYDLICAQDVGGNSKTKKDVDCNIAVKQDESNSCLTPLQCDESSLGSVASSCETGSTRRKRRTHAEAFIHDNLDYYKFEIPGSRLRHQGVNSPNTSACKNVKESKLVDTNEVSVQVSLSPSSADLGQEEIIEVIVPSENLEAPKDVKESELHSVTETSVKNVSSYSSALQGLQYSFELVPESEPWYQTYKRQDEGEEVYFPQCESVRWRTFLLPYEMPQSDIHGSTIEPCTLGEAGGLKYKRRRRKKYAHLLDSKPRKSPRCHASTLAILSSLRHNRKRKEAEKREQSTGAGVQECGTLDESSQDVSVEAVSSKSDVCEPEPAELFQEIENNFAKLLTADKEDSLSIDIQVQDCELSVAGESSNVPKKFPAAERRRSSHSCRRKSTLSSRKLNGVNSSKQSSEMEPVILESLRQSRKEQLGSAVCLPKRSGLDSDVVELLSTCWCFDKDTLSCRDCSAPKCEAVTLLSELSCNSSECSMASCDSSLFSDMLGKNSKSCTRRRKKKKNLTGWPIERHRKKGMKKVAEDDDDDSKCNTNASRCNLDSGNKTDDGFSNVGIPSRDGVDNEECIECVERTSNNVDRAVDNVERTANDLERTSNISERLAGNVERIENSVDETTDSMDRTKSITGRAASSVSRTADIVEMIADNVERVESVKMDNVQVSSCVGENNLVPNTSPSADIIAGSVCCVEDARQNGLSDANSSKTTACGQMAEGAANSCKSEACASDVIEEPVVKDDRGSEGGFSSECGAGSSSVNTLKAAKHGLTRTVSLEASRQSCEYQPCVRVMKITNLADMLSYSQGAVVANSRRLRSASSPSSMSSPPRRSQECDVQPRRASPRKRVSKGWEMLVSKRR